MKFTWDENKEQKNIEKHGFGFDYAKKILSAFDVFIAQANIKANGENRLLAFSTVENMKLCLCFVVRKDTIRIISIRRYHD